MRTYAISDVIDYRIYGNDIQSVEIHLDAGETVYAEPGAMIYTGHGIEMKTGTGDKHIKGVLSGIKRMATGEDFLVVTYTNNSKSESFAAFTAPYPGTIVPLDLGLTGDILCQREAFLCAAKGTELSANLVKNVGAGLFGGEGFVLQRLSGNGIAFIHAGGAIIEKNLEAGEKIQVDTGCLVAFSHTVDYSIKRIRGVTNMALGGEGAFLATLTGVGKVYIQNMPFSRLVKKITRSWKETKKSSNRR